MKFGVILEDATATAVLRRLHPQTRTRIKQGLALLATDPYGANPQTDVKRLETDPTKEAVYRLRIGVWRLVYTIEGAKVRVVRVMHREEGYDWLE